MELLDFKFFLAKSLIGTYNSCSRNTPVSHVSRREVLPASVPLCDPNQNYNLLTDKFLGLANKHAPLKKKFVRGNNAPFMNREFQKKIYVRSRLRNKYWVEPSAKNKAAYKIQRNKCVKIRRKSIKRYMDEISEKGIETNKSFWNFIKPFMTNKSMIANKDITLIDGKNVITDEYELSQIFISTSISTLSKNVAETNLIK